MTDVIDANLAKFLLTVFVIEITPGPNMGYLAALSMTRGRAAGLAATAGVAAGLTVHAVAAAFGAGALISASPILYEALRWAGVLFLIWLAYEGWRDAETSPAQAAGGGDAHGLFWRGLVTNVLNPKSVLFFVAVVPRFIEEERGGIFQQLALLGILYVAVATVIHASVVVLAARAGGLISGERGRAIRKVLSLGLVAIAIWLAWDTRRAGG
ncbi:threonine transporter RhtB [Terrihabitans soli]|uniref:Threonine transporter RhtB n=1 Tax=Terrihabitans soli TaxID=708113 RepID=A0A6S6QVC2_9HYPH|nr:LysE family translocator [Terrihabitans soli]BCJ90940.1 threonine transporter RhtB [Terrihabitans soli]